MSYTFSPSSTVQRGYGGPWRKENSDCIGYITKKYWKRASYNSVPIVSVRQIYKNSPPHSFIAMDDFESPKQLAEYLEWLIGNPKEYLKYFAYRNDGWNAQEIDKYDDNFCSLCRKIVDIKKNKNKVFHKVFYNARRHFLRTTKCFAKGYVWRKWYGKEANSLFETEIMRDVIRKWRTNKVDIKNIKNWKVLEINPPL
uniref:Fucosyltransferase n=1 Tax=Rhabditophanes sp. KR3021 TaxID=114890 RepID=A0AC35TN22_9BILA